MVSIFTLGGSSKEIPWLIKAFVSIAGRDTYFFGDINKVKVLWHEHIKFFDLNNFFDEYDLKTMSEKWLDSKVRENVNRQSESDPVRRALMIRELALKLFKTLESIKFGEEALGKAKSYSFLQHQPTSSATLAMSVFQNAFLAP